MRIFLGNLLLVVVSSLICLMLLEIGLRIVGYNPFGALLNGRELILRQAKDPDMAYELTPNSKGQAWGTMVSVNSHGFRDREFSPVKADSVYRIGVIGDSITFGNHLPLQATYPKQLEQLFRGQALNVEVLNLGVGGYDTTQEVAFLEKLAAQFSFDEVVLGYCMNDTGMVSVNLSYINRAKMYDSKIYYSRALQFIRAKLDRIDLRTQQTRVAHRAERPAARSARFGDDSYVKDRIRWINDYVETEDGHHTVLSWYGDPARLDAIERSFAKLKSMSNYYGFRVSVVIIPFLDHVEANQWAYEIIEYEAKRYGFDTIDIQKGFKEAGIKKLAMSSHDNIHPNAEGHRIIADALLSFFMSDRPGADALPRSALPKQ